jgi:hypothetical protein
MQGGLSRFGGLNCRTPMFFDPSQGFAGPFNQQVSKDYRVGGGF